MSSLYKYRCLLCMKWWKSGCSSSISDYKKSILEHFWIYSIHQNYARHSEVVIQRVELSSWFMQLRHFTQHLTLLMISRIQDRTNYSLAFSSGRVPSNAISKNVHFSHITGCLGVHTDKFWTVYTGTLFIKKALLFWWLLCL